MSSWSETSIATIAGAALGVVGQIAVGHDIDVGIDVGEHAADDMAFALLPLAANDGPGGARDLNGGVAAIIVEHVDRGGRQRGAKAGDGRGDGRFLIIARQHDRHAQPVDVRHCNPPNAPACRSRPLLRDKRRSSTSRAKRSLFGLCGALLGGRLLGRSGFFNGGLGAGAVP